MPTWYAFTPIPPSRAASTQNPEIVSELAGIWRGRLVRSGAEAGTPFTLIRDASMDATVAGRFLFFSTRDVAPTGVRLLEASRSAFVALVGPYFDAEENADVVTVLEGRRVGEMLQGTFNTRLVRGWRRGRSGWFSAERA
jgi:hypothetical protein